MLPQTDRPTAQPVAPAERLAPVDVLRGVALLGILAMNIVCFAWPFAGYEDPNYSGGDTPANRAAWMINGLVFAEKMVTLFSMLFGAGLVLMAERAAARGARFRWIYLRRIIWLLVFGVIHGYLIWFGDILVIYAGCGALLFFFRRMRPKLLIGLGVGLVLFGSLSQLAIHLFAGFTESVAAQAKAARAAGNLPAGLQEAVGNIWSEGFRPYFRPTPAEVAEETAAFRGSYLEIVANRAPSLALFQAVGLPLVLLWMVGGRMLLGMGLMKLGVFATTLSWRCYLLLVVCGYGAGVPLTLLGLFDLLQHQYDPTRAPWGALLLSLGTVPTALGHAAVVMLMCKAGALSRLTRSLAAAGRMALTNYLMQSLICTTLFYGYGVGLFGYLDRVQLWGVVLAIWLLQLVVSPLWLTFFRYGPAEWLWRSLTYWSFQPMRLHPKHLETLEPAPEQVERT
jgi:uncharacterized protein